MIPQPIATDQRHDLLNPQLLPPSRWTAREPSPRYSGPRESAIPAPNIPDAPLSSTLAYAVILPSSSPPIYRPRTVVAAGLGISLRSWKLQSVRPPAADRPGGA
ncbi:hypothetical protein BDN71DRAFT_1510307 [Pleurotus eryngii]|uniref:Uncharacterized protein n=1 Tax=Pleurotus eryngii TaxID=5323 RepID=A0A9P5ZRT7_PLEER|nr:hypothetical protein BDN71DRAFT_1510307 [Pleurotus eryngii]